MKGAANIGLFSITRLRYIGFLWALVGVGRVFASDIQLAEEFDVKRAAYSKGMMTEDSQLLAQYYADDIRLMPEANPTILGKTNAQLFFAALFVRFDVTAYQRVQTDVVIMDDHRAEIGNFELKMTNSQGKEYDINGKYMMIWRLDASEFKLTADIWNFDGWIDHHGELTFRNVPSTVLALEQHLPINTPILFELAAYGVLADHTVPMRDASVLTQFYSDDAIVLPNNRSMIRGLQAIRDYWDVHVNELPGFEKLQSRTNKVEVLGQYVLQYSSHIASWRSGENSGVSTGKHIRIWQRVPQGGLKTRVLISAYDR